MSLRWNATTREYVVFTTDDEKAKEVGLTLAKNKRGPRGENIYFTDSPYAALCYYDEADEETKKKLAPLQQDYGASWRSEWDGPAFPCPSHDQNGNPLSYMPYQNAGIQYGLDHQNVLIADEPGLGKTGQSIGIANAKKYERNLIICPANLRANWRREIRKWSIIPDVRTYPVFKAKDGISPAANYVIVSYELCRNDAIHQALYEQQWGSIIIDEAHYLKEKGSQRTYAVLGGGRKGEFKHRPLVERADKTICLTGTPLPNRPRECFTIARALHPESIDFMNFDDFKYRYNPSAQVLNPYSDTIVNIEKRGRLPELQNRLRCNFMIRRMKKDVLKHLPDKRYELTYVEPTGEIANVIARERLLEFSVSDLVNPDAALFGQISTIRREMGAAKLPRVIEHIKFLLEVTEVPKVLVFFHHREVMDRFAQAMGEFGIVELRGGMSVNQKIKSVNDFMTKPEVRIFSGQMQAAGVGIDGLQNVCTHCVVAEASWVPGENEQAIDRLHRQGQHGNVIAQFIVVEGSLDERILAAIIDKTDTIHTSLDRR